MELYQPSNINIIGNDLPPILELKYNIYYVKENFLIEPTTNISVVGNDLPPIVELNYNHFPEMPSPTRISEVNYVENEHKLNIYSRNLLNIENTTKTYNTYIRASAENNIITYNGTTENSYTYFSFDDIHTILFPGTYTLSYETEGETTNTYTPDIDLINSQNGRIITTIWRGGPSGSKNFTITETTECYIRLSTQMNTTYTNYQMKFQIEKGSVPSYYSPYVKPQNFIYNLGNIELYKIANYSDSIKYNITDQKWYLYKHLTKKNIADIVQTSGSNNNENIVFKTYDTNTSGFGTTFDILSKELPCISTHFTWGGPVVDDTEALTKGVGIYTNYININTHPCPILYVVIPKSIANTLSTFKNWCENNNVYIWYIHEDPTNEEIQDYDLVEKLNAILEQGKLYDTTMIVEDTPEDSGISGDIEVNYLTNTTFNGIYASRAELNITQNSIESTVSETFTTSVQPVIDSVNMLGEQLQNTEANLQSNIDDVSNSLNNYALNSSLVTVTNTVQNIQTALNQQILVSKELQENGVTKVTTTTGFTFDENGLSITKTGADTRTVVDEDGLTVYSATGSSETPLLDVNSQGVETENLHVRTYTQIGSHSRLQDYEDGTAIFYIA